MSILGGHAHLSGLHRGYPQISTRTAPTAGAAFSPVSLALPLVTTDGVDPLAELLLAKLLLVFLPAFSLCIYASGPSLPTISARRSLTRSYDKSPIPNCNNT
ncbi:hypothetical protein DFP73DRAFT_528401 [Morchella snyderi]|nr:hypothetical protein DFP73DRAFT_528401 [Morchella snyderi]